MFIKSVRVENERIIQALERIAELQEKILFQLQSGSHATEFQSGEWIDSFQVQRRLEISRSTLHRRTKENSLKYRKIGGRRYYLGSEIFKLKDHYLK